MSRLAFSLVILVAPLLTASGSAPQRPLDTTNVIELSAARVDFGQVGHYQTETTTLTVRNVSEASVSVIPKPSCDCIDIRFDGQDLAPGESRRAVIAVRFGRGRSRFGKHVDFEPQRKGARALSFHVLAEFHPGVSWEPMSLRLFTASDGELEADHASFTVKSSTGKLDLGTPRGHRLSGCEIETRVETVSDSEARIHVTAKTGERTGPFRGDVVIPVNGLDLAIPISGTAFENFATIPETVAFSRVDDISKGVSEVIVSATDGKPFEIASCRFVANASHQVGEIETQAQKLEEGRYRVTIRLLEPQPKFGRIGGEVRMTTTHPDQSELTVRVLGLVSLK